MRIIRGEEYTMQGKLITDYPQGIKDFVRDNADKIRASQKRGTAPYFVQNKAGVIDGILNPIENTSTSDNDFNTVSSDDNTKMKPMPIMDISVVSNEMNNFAKAHPEYFSKGYNGLFAESHDTTYMSTDAKGVININFAEDNDGFNAGKELVSAMNKLKKSQELNQNEEYAMECLWHEILHNKSKNKYDIPGWYDTFERVSVETINQLVARHTYDSLLSNFGVAPKYKDWVLKDGYGYNKQVANLRLLLKSSGIDEGEFVNDIQSCLFNDYSNFDEVVIRLLKKKYKGKGNIEWAFKHIDDNNMEEYLRLLKILP